MDGKNDIIHEDTLVVLAVCLMLVTFPTLFFFMEHKRAESVPTPEEILAKCDRDGGVLIKDGYFPSSVCIDKSAIKWRK